MVEHLIKTINTDSQLWQLPTYKIGIHSYHESSLDISVASKPAQSTLPSWCSLVIHLDSPLITICGLCDLFDEHANPEVMVDQMILKMQLIANVHKCRTCSKEIKKVVCC
jgi:hypothetical protein